MVDLGLTERRFWSLTPRELTGLFRALALREGRWRFYIATSMGAKHTSRRALTLEDFLPPKQRRSSGNWQDMLASVRAYVDKSNRLISMAGKVVTEADLKDLIN